MEISTAVADVRCKRQVDLIDIWVSAEVEMQKSVIKQFHRELMQSKKLLETMVRNAHRVLSGQTGDSALAVKQKEQIDNARLPFGPRTWGH
jgi:hypothetical protein